MSHSTKLIAASLLAGIAVPASAAVVLNVQNVGNDLVISGGGTLDITTWNFDSTVSNVPSLSDDGVSVGTSANVDFYTMPANFAGVGTIETGRGATANSGTGDAFGLFWVDDIGGSVPVGYVSGSPLLGTATFLNESLATFNLSVGQSFTWTWDTASAGTDSFTINVVPEPTSLAVMLVALAGVARRRRN